MEKGDTIMLPKKRGACMGKMYLYRGKRYSTESAMECGCYGTCTLYKKRTGEFFIYDSGSDKITPLKHEKAKEWAEKHINGFEKFFKGSAAKKVTSFSISADSIEKTKELAVKLNCTSSKVIEEAVRQMYKTVIG